MNTNFILILVFSLGSLYSAQAQTSELDSLKSQMLENNKGLKASKMSIEHSEMAEGEAFQFQKLQIYQNYDEAEWDPIANEPLYQWGATQNFDFPTVYGKRLQRNKSKTQLKSIQNELRIQQQFKQLETLYQNHLVLEAKLEIYNELDSVYADFSRMAKRKFEEGESSYLEKITAESKQTQIQNQLQLLENERENNRIRLQNLVQTDKKIELNSQKIERLDLELKALKDHPNIALKSAEVDLAKNEWKLAKNELLPGISASYFRRSNSAIDKHFNGYQIGLNVPLLFFGDRAKIKAQKLQTQVAEFEQEQTKIELENEQEQFLNSISAQSESLNRFENSQLKVAEEILKTAKSSFKNGEINFFQYAQSVDNASQIKLEYLKLLAEYNQQIIHLNYLLLN